MQWHAKTIEQTYQELVSSDKGLAVHEVRKRLKHYGQNRPMLKKDPFWKLIIEPFRSLFVGVLIVAGVVSALTHETLDSVIILTIISINAAIFYTQQYATNRVLRSLKKKSVQKVHVLRDSKRKTVSSLKLVPGDIIFLTEGERVPADARLVQVDNLQLDESALTGESLPVYKTVSTLGSDTPIYERHNMVLQGTYILAGRGRAMVVETGPRTEFGLIARLASQTDEKSPVQQKIDHIVARLIQVLVVVAILVFVLSLIRGLPVAEALRFVLAMSVSVVPEGLPVALTIIVVLGMRRMAKHKALVRSFKAIEDIGLITTIATDKTGTLTKNHLRVVDSWSPAGNAIDKFVARTIDPNESSIDPLDTALKEHVGHMHKTGFKQFYPFNPSLRVSGAYYDDEHMLYLKGLPEHVLAGSHINHTDRQKAESIMHTFASKGYRVIAIARQKLRVSPKDLNAIQRSKHEFLGFVACADELRPEAKSAIEAVQAAGIKVKLITGDHFETAYHIGSQIGLVSHRNQIVVGSELPKSTAALAAVIRQKTVFARILPEDKFRILQALKTTDITAMTGDGVNDVPALADAHVGIAMGSGSDIAKDAANIVLLNDNFATIIKALSEGRKIFDNIRRMLFYLLSTSLGEIFTMIGALLLGLPLPVTAIQILWINLVTDTALVLPLGLEPAEKDHMTQPPRKPKDPLLSRMLLIRMILVAGTMALVTLIIVKTLRDKGYTTPYIQTVAFMALIAAQWMNAFNARSERESIFTRLRRANYGFAVGLTVAIILQFLVMFGPLREVFGIQQVDTSILAVSTLGIMLAVLFVVETQKFVLRHLPSSTEVL